MSFRAFGPLLCGGFLLLAVPALAAQGDPLPGIDVSMEQNPGGIIIHARTNGQGVAVFGNVPPGNYTVKQGGHVIKTITINKAGPVSVPVTQGAGGGAR
jgi:hypothetical protein